MSAPSSDLQFAREIDWSKPDAIEGGKRIFNVRCRVGIPVIRQAASKATEVSPDATAADLTELAAEMGAEIMVRDFHDIGHNGDSADAAVDGEDTEEADRFGGATLISGIASSTSVDFYGTEMSTRALKMMAIQMMGAGGLAYIPRHSRGLAGGIEWDEVIGRTVHAEVVPAESVAKAYNESESQWLLRVTVELFEDEPASENLMRRISRGESIGQSIGGWFTNLQIIQNEDGDVERVIVLGVELDHLAVTRAPANPDSVGLVQLRSVIADSAADHRAADLLPRVVSGQVVRTTGAIARSMIGIAAERHVLNVVNNGDGTASITLAISGEGEDGDDEARSDDAAAEPSPEDTAEAHEAHEQIGSDRAEAEPSDGRVTLPQGADADEAALSAALAGAASGDLGPEVEGALRAGAPSSLDTTPATGDDTGAIDARRGALPNDDPTPAANVATSEEPAMPEQDDTPVSIDAIRSAIAGALQPVTARLDAIDERAAAPVIDTVSAPVVEPTVDERVAAAERATADAMSRAKTAEEALARTSRRPMRTGRSVMPSFSGPAAVTGFEGIISDCRSKFPSLAAIAERCVSTATEQNGAAKVSRRMLNGNLSALLCAAETDGIITDPNHRAVWQ